MCFYVLLLRAEKECDGKKTFEKVLSGQRGFWHHRVHAQIFQKKSTSQELYYSNKYICPQCEISRRDSTCPEYLTMPSLF